MLLTPKELQELLRILTSPTRINISSDEDFIEKITWPVGAQEHVDEDRRILAVNAVAGRRYNSDGYKGMMCVRVGEWDIRANNGLSPTPRRRFFVTHNGDLVGIDVHTKVWEV